MGSVHVAQALQQSLKSSVPLVAQSTHVRSALAEPVNLMPAAAVVAQHCVIAVHLLPAAPFVQVLEDDQMFPLTHGTHCWLLLQVLHAASTVVASAFQPRSRSALAPVSQTVHCGGWMKKCKRRLRE